MMVELINNQQNLLQEIQNFDVNKSRMWDAIYVGFELMSKLFSVGEIPNEIVCKEVQHQLCNSTSQGNSKVLPNSADVSQISELFA